MNARDAYQDGHGNMFGKLAGLFTIFDARGAEIDQGSVLRFRGEMIWFPTAFLGQNITWQDVDESSPGVSLADGARTVSACLSFDSSGRPVNFNAMCYGDFEEGYALRSWSVPVTPYETRGGPNIPVRGW